MANQKGPLLTVLPIVCNIISLVLLCLIIFSGFNGGLSQVHWMSAYSGNVRIPSKLAGSEYMAALSTVSKADYVGQGATAASLGLPDWTSIHLLTECSHFADGRVDCTRPSYGFSFTPARDLKLDSTSLQGVVSDDLNTALTHYSRASRWLSGAYVISAFFSLLAPIESCFMPLWASFTAGVGTLLLLTATITATAIFKKVVDAFNAQFGALTLTASLGAYPIAFGFVSCFLTFLATIAYIAAYRRQQRGSGLRAGFGGAGHDKGGLMHGGVGADSEYHGAAGATRSRAGLFNRVGAGNPSHKYVQIEEQHGAMAGAGGDLGEREMERGGGGYGAPGSPDGIRPSRLDEDWAAPDDYAGTSGAGGAGKTSSGPGASIPLMALGGGNKQTKDLNTAYEPLSDPR